MSNDIKVKPPSKVFERMPSVEDFFGNYLTDYIDDNDTLNDVDYIEVDGIQNINNISKPAN